jgi:CheY-like chemotaxis protein
MQENANLAVLVIDPNPGMRTSLQNMLGLAGITKVEHSVNAGTAIRQLQQRAFDIILCEYDLASGAGEGQDGQQLLEDLRQHRLITPSTIFIMLTSEAERDKVVSAAELAPTDYLLKPFTVDLISTRIKRALDRRGALLLAWQLAAQGRLREAITACADGAQAQPRFAADFARVRAELHTTLGEHPEAAAVYRDVLAERPVGWAALGLARALLALGQPDDARAILEELLAANPRLMAAYDLLAHCLASSGEPALAQRVLADAVAMSPHVVQRLRTLGELALATGDLAVAETSFRQVVARARYSAFRDPEDHVSLVRTLVARGELLQAAGVIRDLERSLRAAPGYEACHAYANALLFDRSGNDGAAVAGLQNAVSAVRANNALSSGLKVELARSCLAYRLDDQAAGVMLTVVNDAGSGLSPDQAMTVFVDAGRADLLENMGQQLKAQAQILLGVADEKRNMGDVRGAVQTLREALHLAPRNLQVMVATAGGILRQINELGWDHPLGQTAAGLLDEIRAQDAQHPRLATLTEEYQAARRKYGIAAG